MIQIFPSVIKTETEIDGDHNQQSKAMEPTGDQRDESAELTLLLFEAWQARKRLNEAAPDMLAQLHAAAIAIAYHADDCGPCSIVLKGILAAIAKAEAPS